MQPANSNCVAYSSGGSVGQTRFRIEGEKLTNSNIPVTPGVPCERNLDSRPVIAHVLLRLAVGGLENGLVNLINELPANRYRHVVVCIDDYTDFSNRISRDDVEIVAIRKKPGTDISALWRLYKTFRRVKPAIVHTRNLAALDALLPAMLAGVRCRIHSEHGWDTNDLDGQSRRMQILRKIHSPLVNRYVALSGHLADYLTGRVGINQRKVQRLCNGVDVKKFRPATRHESQTSLPAEFSTPGNVLIGMVGRLQAVKNPLGLLDAFVLLLKRRPDLAANLRLLFLGDGQLFSEMQTRVSAENLQQLVWLAGSRDDVPQILRLLDVFVLPSLAEGISNTVLEAMASGVPVIANNVGGNPELVDDGLTGALLPAADIAALAAAIEKYADDAVLRDLHGRAGRARVEDHFSLSVMVQGYMTLYDQFLGSR